MSMRLWRWRLWRPRLYLRPRVNRWPGMYLRDVAPFDLAFLAECRRRYQPDVAVGIDGRGDTAR